MKITITHDKRGLSVDFDSNDWDHYKAIGMLEQTKFIIQKEIERMIKNNP